MAHSWKTHLIGTITSKLNRCEVVNDTVNIQQTFRPIAVLEDITDRDLEVELILKFPEE